MEQLLMDIKNDQERILKELMHNPHMSFNQLWDKQGRSNKFAYHLKVLERTGLVMKTQEGFYGLTSEGKQHVTYIDGETGKKAKAPLFAVTTIIFDEQTDKFLMLKRTKEPFYGYWGFHGGKLKFGQYIYECAQAEIQEETGLECDIELKGLFSAKTFDNDELSYNHQLFIIKATNPRGTLLPETREGNNRWVSKEELKDMKILPNIPHLIEIAMSDTFRWVEADRFQEQGVFKSMDVRRDYEI